MFKALRLPKERYAGAALRLDVTLVGSLLAQLSIFTLLNRHSTGATQWPFRN